MTGIIFPLVPFASRIGTLESPLQIPTVPSRTVVFRLTHESFRFAPPPDEAELLLSFATCLQFAGGVGVCAVANMLTSTPSREGSGHVIRHAFATIVPRRSLWRILETEMPLKLAGPGQRTAAISSGPGAVNRNRRRRRCGKRPRPRESMSMKCSTQTRNFLGRMAGIAVLLAGALLASTLCFGAPSDPSQIPSIFRPQSTPANSIFHLSLLVLAITGVIFAVVFSLLAYSVRKFRQRDGDDGREPPQVYGSNQVELAWTVIPVLIVLVLFLATARVIHSIQDAPKPAGAIEVIAIGHQFWWEFRYPALGVVTANELHVPVSNSSSPTPTFLTLLSADTDHSFWVPRLAGKTDLIPNRVNHTWIDPEQTGVY